MQTSLNLEIDYVATAKRVTNFLDKKLDRYLALSGKRRFDLKSPSMDGMPKVPTKGNASENRMLTSESQQILLSRYSDQMLTYNIAQELSISSATYSRKQEQALCEFADRFEFQVFKHNIQAEVADLHVYVK